MISMSSIMDDHRSLTPWQRDVILRLLKPAFPGRDELLAQLESAVGRPIDDNGSLELRCACSTNAPVKRRIPTEAEAKDRDGMTIHYLLHVVDGRMNELEVYKDDSSRLIQHAEPEDLEVIILD